MVLVSAPAGYGKSTLVAQWSELDPRPSLWVQLGPRDNDPVVLLARVVAALERTGPVCAELLEELSGRMPRIDEVVIPLLAADLGERDPFVLPASRRRPNLTIRCAMTSGRPISVGRARFSSTTTWTARRTRSSSPSA